MKYNYKIIDFLATRNVVEVKTEKEFDKFYEVLKKMGLEDIFPYDSFDEWKVLAKINNRSEEFYFEYDNSRGLTWYDNAKQPTDWYGINPIKVDELYDKEGEIKHG